MLIYNRHINLLDYIWFYQVYWKRQSQLPHSPGDTVCGLSAGSPWFRWTSPAAPQPFPTPLRNKPGPRCNTGNHTAAWGTKHWSCCRAKTPTKPCNKTPRRQRGAGSAAPWSRPRPGAQETDLKEEEEWGLSGKTKEESIQKDSFLGWGQKKKKRWLLQFFLCFKKFNHLFASTCFVFV